MGTYLYNLAIISIHAPTRGATASRDLSELDMDISIHAPTRGATIDWVSNPLCNAISIHAPTRGATKKERLKGGKNEFQSTLPRGERRAELQALETVQAISIHAPTRGATGDSRRPAVGNFYFNPRSHEGSDSYS